MEQVIVRVKGKLFRCDCGCNVFHYIGAKKNMKYECNGCGATYTGANEIPKGWSES